MQLHWSDESSDQLVYLFQSKIPDLSFADETFDGCLCDPPYGLSFMGKGWDHGVPDVDTWRAVYRVLKPGAFLLAFGGTRTHHRLMCAIEDAGFEIRDVIMYMYGVGFPKSLNIGKAIDKAARGVPQGGADPTSANHGKYKGGCSEDNPSGRGFGAGPGQFMADVGRKASLEFVAEAQPWAGFGTALKPAYEIIICAQKPQDWQGLCAIMVQRISESLCQLAKDVALISTSSRAGLEPLDSALWTAVQKCSSPGDLFDLMDTLLSGSEIPSSLSTGLSWLESLGVILKHGSTFTTETKSSLTTDLKILNSLSFPSTPEDIIEAATNPLGIGSSASIQTAVSIFNGVRARLRHTLTPSARGPVTSQPRTSRRDVLDRLSPAWEPIIVAMKPCEGTFAENALKHGVAGMNIEAGRIGTSDHLNGGAYSGGERPNQFMNGGLYRKQPEDFMQPTGRWPANVVLDEEAGQMLDQSAGDVGGGFGTENRADGQGRSGKFSGATKGKVVGFGDSGGASRFFYCAKASKSERGEGNNHPTVKPLKLIEYLAKLILPPNGGHLFVPFSGSGSEVIAARNVGWDVTGVELDPSYLDIAVKRLSNHNGAH